MQQDDFEKIRNHPKLSIIGHMTEDVNEQVMVTNSGQDIKLKAQGWDSIKA